MIKTETVIINGKQFIRTYSDNNMYIHGGFPEADYSEAYDPAEFGRTYIETNLLIEEDLEPNTPIEENEEIIDSL